MSAARGRGQPLLAGRLDPLIRREIAGIGALITASSREEGPDYVWLFHTAKSSKQAAVEQMSDRAGAPATDGDHAARRHHGDTARDATRRGGAHRALPRGGWRVRGPRGTGEVSHIEVARFKYSSFFVCSVSGVERARRDERFVLTHERSLI